MKGGNHVVDADGHVYDTAPRLLPYVDEPYRERVDRLVQWKAANASGGHLSAAALPYSELAQGFERTGRRLLGTRDVADNLDPALVGVGEMAKFHPMMREGSGYDPVVTREDLMARVWDENWFGSTKTLDTTIGRLRQKLLDGGAPVALETVRGVGFRLVDEYAAPDA